MRKGWKGYIGRIDAGSVAHRFPEVTSIAINMTYTQRGIKSLLRTFRFSPSSPAFFKVDCLSEDCDDGGFDLTQVIAALVRSHTETTKRELSCDRQ